MFKIFEKKSKPDEQVKPDVALFQDISESVDRFNIRLEEHDIDLKLSCRSDLPPHFGGYNVTIIDVASCSDDTHQSQVKIETFADDEGFSVMKTDAQGGQTSLGACLSSAVVMAKVRIDVVESLDIDPDVKQSFCFDPHVSVLEP